MTTTDQLFSTLNTTTLPNLTDNTAVDPLAKMQAEYDNYVLVKVTYYMASYFIWVVFAFGLPGNIASIFTIMTMPTISSSKAHVAILAVADTLAIISKVTYHEVSGHQAYLSTAGCSILMFVQQFLTVYVNWVVVAMTTERCLAVCFPLLVGRIYTRRKALAVLAGFAVMTASVYLVLLWAFVEVDSGNSNYYCTVREAYRAYLGGQIHYWLDASVGSLVPCVLVLTGNALIVFSIRRAKKTQITLTGAVDRGGRQSRDQRQITIMLIAVSMVFLVLNIPNALFYLTKNRWSRGLQKYSYDMAVFYFIARLVHALTDANHAVNFYLYFLSMSTFRRRFLDSIRCKSASQRRGPVSSMYRTSHTYMQCPQLNREISRSDIACNTINSGHRRLLADNSCNHGGGSTQSMKSYNDFNRGCTNDYNSDTLTVATSQV
ncbi:thyrotropin-releasing hormone receptor [Plakobranchus ocellatus]|uniref:Thyrotropin-releasing hormone receptor n=1 Tax=Plakobranchus ocellatus TaxID=259542 RepID=A0AAV3XXY9_9GAST|nr:thyrotropin-releasing hormone receptor [Plakobranchus ocellatus]